MKKFRELKIITCIFLLSVLFMAPKMVLADDMPTVSEKVKVYIFEAGGCPWCEKEEAYLKSLDSYNKKFEIVQKKTFTDHDTWGHDVDYDLAVAVSEAFQAKGFTDADYNGTPFVIISDIYAVTNYSEDLEQYIDRAYEEGDRDAVSCIAAGRDDCIRDTAETLLKKDNSKTGLIVVSIILAVVLSSLVGLIVFVALRNKNNRE